MIALIYDSHFSNFSSCLITNVSAFVFLWFVIILISSYILCFQDVLFIYLFYQCHVLSAVFQLTAIG